MLRCANPAPSISAPLQSSLYGSPYSVHASTNATLTGLGSWLRVTGSDPPAPWYCDSPSSKSSERLVRQHLRQITSPRRRCTPSCRVDTVPAHVDHSVERTRPAQHLAARPEHRCPGGVDLRLGGVGVVHLAVPQFPRARPSPGRPARGVAPRLCTRRPESLVTTCTTAPSQPERPLAGAVPAAAAALASDGDLCHLRRGEHCAENGGGHVTALAVGTSIRRRVSSALGAGHGGAPAHDRGRSRAAPHRGHRPSAPPRRDLELEGQPGEADGEAPRLRGHSCRAIRRRPVTRARDGLALRLAEAVGAERERSTRSRRRPSARHRQARDLPEILHKPAALERGGAQGDRAAHRDRRAHPRAGRVPTRRSVFVRSAHERWDGGGYPDGLGRRGDPARARILSLDAYDAMTTDRSYRGRAQPCRGDRRGQRCSGSQFDPQLAQAFLQLG